MDLLKKSTALLTLYQHRHGSFPAAPFYPVYQYCWLRDGTFCAYALDLVGLHKNSRSYYLWVNETLKKHLPKLEGLEEKVKRGTFKDDDFLHTRFTLDGNEGKEPWGNFQLDGYGTYLWGLAQHLKLSHEDGILHESMSVVQAVAQYLQKYWYLPCLDSWEENKNIHPSTLASIYGGLTSLKELLPPLVEEAILERIKTYVRQNFSKPGYFFKTFEENIVDANLLWLAVPYKLVESDDPLMVKTVEKIEEDIKFQGLYRYRGDTFYGGGEWLILTAWLGWYYVEAGRREEAQKILKWLELQADDYGQLPEQVPHHVQYPEKYSEWVARWGEIAKPLLWSHAMYIILHQALFN